ncbi:Uncharacterised protein [Vibrio cholerae]|nr:Uncharacterised protein [Vibrio cholerae]CSC39311.1 Uncharacterised protein [Vibrio cholerae]CSI47022.1 Uncharacterised protein [Vibrio cholerae]
MPAGLEINIGIINLASRNTGQRIGNILFSEPSGCQQCRFNLVHRHQCVFSIN